MSLVNPEGAHVLDIEALIRQLRGDVDIDTFGAKSPIRLDVKRSSSEIRPTLPLVLPHQTEELDFFALDIGGTLIKMVYFESENPEDVAVGLKRTGSIDFLVQCPEKYRKKGTTLSNERITQNSGGGMIKFMSFMTEDVDKCIAFIEQHNCHKQTNGVKKRIRGTGGGAFKYSHLLESRLGVPLEKLDEMESLILGSNFLLRYIPGQTFTYGVESQKRMFDTDLESPPFPYLLVNVGSGVSIIRVNGDTSYERISGSCLGGGTFWGLCKMLTGCNSFDEALALTLQGDNSNVDMLVRDVYGSGYTAGGLAEDLIASTFGKMSYSTEFDEVEFQSKHKADIARSLLFGICFNIAQIAFLNAQCGGLKRIYFGGYFIRDHPITMECISFCVRFWSNNEMKAYFFKHEGFLGALGAFFKDKLVDKDHEQQGKGKEKS